MRMLIVEDDRKLAEFVARGLRAERFAVDLATPGKVTTLVPLFTAARLPSIDITG